MSKRRPGVQIQYSTMSAQTKQFLQKICYKETASVDMTRYGFVNDSHPVRLFIKPLRNQLEKIHGKKNQVTKLKQKRDKSVDGRRQTTSSRIAVTSQPRRGNGSLQVTEYLTDDAQRNLVCMFLGERGITLDFCKFLPEGIKKDKIELHTDPRSQVAESIPTAMHNEIENSIDYLINQQKGIWYFWPGIPVAFLLLHYTRRIINSKNATEQKRQNNKKIEESIAKENKKPKKRNRKISKVKKSD